MKRIFSLFCVVLFLFGLNGCAEKKTVSVLDAQGNVIATPTKLSFSEKELSDPRYQAYVSLALQEGVKIISEKENLSPQGAEEFLFEKGLTIQTSFSQSAMDSIDLVYQTYKEENLPFSCAIVDSEGMVCAVYGGGGENLALTPHAPASALKPLSVYAPALDQGLISWKTSIVDKPYKKVADESGNLKDWPTNPSTGYTYQSVSLTQCIRESLNTAAIDTLSSLGETNSISFLENSFEMDLSYEKNKLTIEGEEAVLGNLGMGYLNRGVTPLEIAGYYQIFADQGNYTQPNLILSMKNADGSSYHERQVSEKKVIKEETAYIMNRLLNQVVLPGGTGEKAWFSDDVELIGKTGTGEDEDGNWFVGVTPEYSCAVWHGLRADRKNIAAELFGKIMTNMPKHQKTEFDPVSSVRKVVFCEKSGGIITSNCRSVQLGYFAPTDKMNVCPGH